jgi:hypothetical protein
MKKAPHRKPKAPMCKYLVGTPWEKMAIDILGPLPRTDNGNKYIMVVEMTFQEIRIIATGPCITNQLRDVNTICRRSWYIAAHIWQSSKKIRLIRSLKKFIFRYQDLVEIYSVSAETIINDEFSYSENV